MRRAFFLLLVALLTGCASAVHVTGPPVVPPRQPGWLPTPVALPAGDLIVEPQAGERPLDRLLDRAQHTIFVGDYLLSNKLILRALERASAQEVTVDVLLEPHPYGVAGQPARVAGVLRAAGIGVRWSSPAFALQHAKYIVLDDRIAVISTANLTRAGFHTDRDFLLVDRRQQDVRRLSALFRSDWDRLPAARTGGPFVMSPENARLAFVHLIASARRSIDIYAEEYADPGIDRALRTATRRGVRVRLLLPAVPALKPSAGITVRRLTRPYVHAKAIIVDGKTAFVGSENLSAQSLDRNREVGLLVNGGVVRQLSSLFARDWQRGRS